MTNEEKALEIGGTSSFGNERYKAALEMAHWKDEQYNEEKKELLVLVNMLSIDEHNQTIIEELKALLQ